MSLSIMRCFGYLVIIGIKAEKEKPKDDQHVIIKWDQARYDFLSKLQKEGHPIGQLVIPTGEVRELISLAADMYYLQLVNELPKNLVARLRSIDGFQGARYEIAVAASMVRAGFSVQWKNERTSAAKVYEFDAFQSYTNETLAVEAKSRRRPGALHQKGHLPDFNQIHLDIFGLYNEAMRQNPEDRPFGVFIDMNLPRAIDPHLNWKNEVFKKLNSEGENFFGTKTPTFLALTNCAWHYDGERTATPEEFLLIIPKADTVKHPIKNEITHQTVVRTLQKFSKIPEEILK